MGLLLNRVTGKLLALDHPVLDSARCINKKQRRAPCTACRDICPNNVFKQRAGMPPDWGLCTDCGLCLSACPTRCITPSNTTIERYLLALKDGNNPPLVCERTRPGDGLHADCLGAFPWEFLAYMALRGKLTLCHGTCETCENSRGRKLLDENLKQLRLFLGARVFEQRVNPDGPPAAERDRIISRRDFFLGALKKSQDTVSKFAPTVSEKDFDGFFFRRLLVSLIKKQQSAEDAPMDYTVLLPVVNAKCYGCGICEKLCPQNALAIAPADDGKMRLTVNAAKCTACGICSAVCRSGAIAQPAATKIDFFRPTILRKIDVRRCRSCGKPLTAGEREYCALCAQTNKT